MLPVSFVSTDSPESSLATAGGFSSFTTSPLVSSFFLSGSDCAVEGFPFPPFSTIVSCRFFRSKLVHINDCIQPHSIAFRSNQGAPTGFVKKSLHPAAKASFLSDSREEAVNATIITGDGNSKSPNSSSGEGLSVDSSENMPI